MHRLPKASQCRVLESSDGEQHLPERFHVRGGLPSKEALKSEASIPMELSGGASAWERADALELLDCSEGLGRCHGRISSDAQSRNFADKRRHLRRPCASGPSTTTTSMSRLPVPVTAASGEEGLGLGSKQLQLPGF